MMPHTRSRTKRPTEYPLKLLRLEPLLRRRASHLGAARAAPTQPRGLPMQSDRGFRRKAISIDRHTTPSRATRSVFVFLLVERFRGEEDGAIEGVGEAAVSSADLHGDDDEFG